MSKIIFLFGLFYLLSVFMSYYSTRLRTFFRAVLFFYCIAFTIVFCTLIVIAADPGGGLLGGTMFYLLLSLIPLALLAASWPLYLFSNPKRAPKTTTNTPNTSTQPTTVSTHEAER